MLHVLEQIPYLGSFVVSPLLGTVHFVVNTAQFLLGI